MLSGKNVFVLLKTTVPDTTKTLQILLPCGKRKKLSENINKFFCFLWICTHKRYAIRRELVIKVVINNSWWRFSACSASCCVSAAATATAPGRRCRAAVPPIYRSAAAAPFISLCATTNTLYVCFVCVRVFISADRFLVIPCVDIDQLTLRFQFTFSASRARILTLPIVSVCVCVLLLLFPRSKTVYY